MPAAGWLGALELMWGLSSISQGVKTSDPPSPPNHGWCQATQKSSHHKSPAHRYTNHNHTSRKHSQNRHNKKRKHSQILACCTSPTLRHVKPGREQREPLIPPPAQQENVKAQHRKSRNNSEVCNHTQKRAQQPPSATAAGEPNSDEARAQRSLPNQRKQEGRRLLAAGSGLGVTSWLSGDIAGSSLQTK